MMAQHTVIQMVETAALEIYDYASKRMQLPKIVLKGNVANVETF